MIRTLITLTALSLAAPAFADGHATGDAEAGASGFSKCKSCHMIVSDTDDVIVKGGRTGPNLYGVIGRQAGSVEGFRYGKDLVRAGEEGLVWDEALLAEWLVDPRGFLRTVLDDSKAKTNMSQRTKKGSEDLAAYLASVGPAPVPTEEAEVEESEAVENAATSTGD